MAPRKRRSHQGLRRCMYPRGRLPRKSRQMEHNQGCSPFYFSSQFSVLSCQPASAAYFRHSPHLPGLLLWVANSADVQSNPHVGQRVFSTVLWKKTRQLRATAGVMQGCGVCPRSWHSQGTGKQEFSKGGAADLLPISFRQVRGILRKLVQAALIERIGKSCQGSGGIVSSGRVPEQAVSPGGLGR